jgi:transposase InsO family protein
VAVSHITTSLGLSIRKACLLVDLSRTVYGYKPAGRLRDECLNTNWLLSLKHARDIIEDWRKDYNTVRPHNALGGLAPEEFMVKAGNF